MLTFSSNHEHGAHTSDEMLHKPYVDSDGESVMLQWEFMNADPMHRAMYKEICRLEALASELTVLNTAPFPTEQVVTKLCAKAPILEDWRLATRLVPCLVGNSFGHPVLEGENRHIATSEIFLLSEGLRCARSSSRWYRLGRPADGQAKDT